MRDKTNLMDKPGFLRYLTRFLGTFLVLYSTSAFASEISAKPVKPEQEQESIKELTIEELRRKYADMCSPSLRTVTETGKNSLSSLDHRVTSLGWSIPKRAISLNDQSSLEQKTSTIEDMVDSCKRLRLMARTYIACGEYTSAEPLAQKALNLAKTNELPTSELSACMLDLALVYKAKREFDRAQPLCEKGLELQKEVFFEEYGYYTETTYDALALRILTSIYKGQGKFEEAEATLYKAINIMFRNNTPRDADGELRLEKLVTRVLNDLGSTYMGLPNPRWDQLMDFVIEYPDSDNPLMDILGGHNLKYNPAIAPFIVDMARLQVARGNFKEAEGNYLKALDSIDNSHGPEHLYTARVKGDLAELYALQGRYSGAETLINQTLKIQEGTYGLEHHFLIPALLTKARIYQGKGEYEKAEKLFDKSLAIVINTGIEGMISEVERDIAGIRAKG